jgi:hypothetical protein
MVDNIVLVVRVFLSLSLSLSQALECNPPSVLSIESVNTFLSFSPKKRRNECVSKQAVSKDKVILFLRG